MGFVLVGIATGLIWSGLLAAFGGATLTGVFVVYLVAGFAGFSFALALSALSSFLRRNYTLAEGCFPVARDGPSVDALQPRS